MGPTPPPAALKPVHSSAPAASLAAGESRSFSPRPARLPVLAGEAAVADVRERAEAASPLRTAPILR
ncbi:unnamed protein product [Urochloa humidicola]